MHGETLKNGSVILFLTFIVTNFVQMEQNCRKFLKNCGCSFKWSITFYEPTLTELIFVSSKLIFFFRKPSRCVTNTSVYNSRQAQQ